VTDPGRIAEELDAYTMAKSTDHPLELSFRGVA